MSRAGLSPSEPRQTFWSDPQRLTSAVWSAVPPLLFGLRLWVAVCLSLYIAFWLELDNAFWAGTSAALVCQPHLGASLRKGWYRMVGTIVGAVAIVVLTACFPQNRVAFLLSLALWGAACSLVATLLRNFASYSAALAGIKDDEENASFGAALAALAVKWPRRHLCQWHICASRCR
jgi:Fusaric acid resistance protein family